MSGSGAASGRERLVSLDVFRGLVISSMLLVNATWGESSWGEGLGSAAALQLAHVPWNAPAQGATLTDLVFPWFIFIMGAAVPLSMRSGRGRGVPGWARLLRACRRGVSLYVLGVVVTHAGSWADRPMAWSDLASWNILQLIGVSYVVAVAVSLFPKWAWWVFVGVVLASKAAVMAGIDAEWARSTLAGAAEPMGPRNPDAPAGAGTFTHYDDVKRVLAREHVAPDGVWAAADRFVLGWLGMAQQWLPCAAIAVLGALATDRLLSAGSSAKDRVRAARGVALAGVAAVALGFALQWGYRETGGGALGALTMPFSKWFFTPAYCLLAAGTGAILLAGCYAAIDVKGWRRLAEPWRTYGVNALALYVGAELLWKLVVSRWRMGVPGDGSSTIPGAVNAWVAWALPDGELVRVGAHALGWSAVSGVAFAALWLAGWWWVCRSLDRRGVYLRV